MDLTVTLAHQQLALAAGACRPLQIGTPIDTFSQNDLQWAAEHGIVGADEIQIPNVALMANSGDGYGYGNGYGSGSGSGYGYG